MLKNSSLVIYYVILSAVWSSSARDLNIYPSPQGDVFGNERFSIRVDPRTGWPGEVLCDGNVVVQMPETKQCFDISQAGQWVTGKGVPVESVSVEKVSQDTFKSSMRAGEWSVDAFVQLFPQERMLRRWFEVSWNGDEASKIKGFWFQDGVLQLKQGGSYFTPAKYPPRRIRTEDLVENRKTNNGSSPCPVIADTGSGWSVLWASDELAACSDRGGVGVEESVGSIRVTRSFNMQGHVLKGTPQKVGDSWIWIAPCDGDTLLKRMPEWFMKVGQVPPDDRPEWLKRVVLYSFHPGGTIGSRCTDLGGFKPATELIPRIHDLGCNAIWLMPLEDKSIYWPRDYYKLQDGLGTPDDYKAFSAEAHSLGMRVWQDCVPHGGCNEYARAKEHPEWLAQNEDGSTLYYWCFDFNWPSWIKYMGDVVSFYTSEYHLDGFRIDACSGSKIPNWNPDIPYMRASHAQAQGGIAMQRALRNAVKAIRPDGANLAEAGSSVFGAVSDSTYDFSLCYNVLHDFRKSPVAEFVPNLRRWLHEQQYSEIPDLVRMRHIESHDSLRSGLWYGAAPQRALMALISWIHGIPMVYHEMEEGNTGYFRRIFHLRHHIAELNLGDADYLGVQAPEGVFACLRYGKLPERNEPAWHDDYAWDTGPDAAERASVVLINFSGEQVEGPVCIPLDILPESLRKYRWVRDMMTGEKIESENGSVQVCLPPFGYTVLRMESRKLPVLKPSQIERNKGVDSKAAESAVVKCDTGKMVLDAGKGMAVAWKSGWFRTLPLQMDLAVPETMAVSAGLPETDSDENRASFKSDWKFNENSLHMQYENAGDGVKVRARWKNDAPSGAALLINLPTAEQWFATSAEGRFENPFHVRHEKTDGVVGSIYRLPQGTSTLWDSRLHPFGLDGAHATVGAICDGRSISFEFNPDHLPASVRILDRIGDDHGMKILIVWSEEEGGLKTGTDDFCFTIRDQDADETGTDVGSGDNRLVEEAGGWRFENSCLRVRFSRNGSLYGIWRRDGDEWKCVLKNGGVYSDRGYADNKRYSQSDDVESYARFERDGSRIKVVFSGALRAFYRFDKMAHPVSYYTEYIFDDGSDFGFTCAVKPSAMPSSSRGFLSMMFHACGIKRARLADDAGVILEEARPVAHGRYVQTATSKNPGRLPTSVSLSDGEKDILCAGNIKWFGALPVNVFLYDDDLHLAWMDGPVTAAAVGRWNGMRCRIGFAGSLSPVVDEKAGFVKDMSVSLLRDGDFTDESAEKMRLLYTGMELPSLGVDGSRAWSLPDGAESVNLDGRRCMKITGNGKDYRLIRQALADSSVKPGTKWRATAVVKSQGVEKADQGWKTACLRWAVCVDGRTVYQTASLPAGDSDWHAIHVDITIPEKLTSISVEAGLNGNAGTIWVDDVSVEEL